MINATSALYHVRLLGVAIVASTLLAGCNTRQARIAQANVNTEQAAERIVSDLDHDHSGGLSEDELSSLDGLAGEFKSYDRDSNGQLTTAEISERLAQAVFDPKVALMQMNCVVRQGNRSLSGATVVLTPLKYFEDSIPSAAGISDENGLVRLSLDAASLPDNAPKLPGFIRPGLYRVSISHPSQRIHKRYNEASQLTMEVSSAAIAKGTPEFDLGAN